MPILKTVQGILSGVTLPLLFRYIDITFPNMNIVQVTCVADKEYQFVLQSDAPGGTQANDMC